MYGYPDPPRKPERNPGDYYDNKRAAADHWRTLLEQAKTDGRPTEEINFLRGRMEMAREVGD